MLLVALVALTSGCRAADNYRRLLPAVTATHDVPYAQADARQQLDLYAPRSEGLHPVVIFVHGGYWHAQGRRHLASLTGLYGNVGVALASKGVLAVVPSYRLHPAVGIEEEVDDVLSALAWTVLHAAEHGGDPRRIVLAGHSAGAHLITTVATQPERLRARGLDPSVVRGMVALSGIYDVPGLLMRADPQLKEEVLVPLFGAAPAAWSPLTALRRLTAPALFVVGEDDYASCLADFEKAQAELRGQRGRARFLMLEGQTHAEVVLEIGSRRDVLTPKIVQFVERATTL